VINTATKYANKSFISRLVGFFSYFSLWVKGWFEVRWVVSFGGFDYCFLFMVCGARNKLGSTLLTLILTPHPIYMWTWLHSPQPGSNAPLPFSHSKQFSQGEQSNRQSLAEA
jgi:hypothetical protein